MIALRAALIAGGSSTRMGTDKASLRLGSDTLLERTVRCACATGLSVDVIGRLRPADWQGPQCTFRMDAQPGCGPLGGIATALVQAGGEAVLALPCDAPLLTVGVLAWLCARWQEHGRRDGTVVVRMSHIEPLFAIYAPQALTLLHQALNRGERSCRRVISGGEFDLAQVPDEHLNACADCDTPQDWQAIGGRSIRAP